MCFNESIKKKKKSMSSKYLLVYISERLAAICLSLKDSLTTRTECYI